MFFQILDNSYGPTNQWPLFFMLFFVLLFIWFIWILVFMFFPIFSPVLSHLDSGFHFVLIVLFIFFFMWISVSFLLLHLHVDVVSLLHFFCLSPVFLVSFFHLYVHAVKHVHFSFGFFRCVCPVHCVLVSHCAVLCLFPVCVYVHSNCFFCKKYPNIFPRHFG